MGNIKGADGLKARLKAVGKSWKPMARKWADTAVDLGHPKLPTRPSSMWAGDKHDPGRLAGSIRRKSITQRKAEVGAHYTAYFIDAGVKSHSMSRRRKGEGKYERAARTVFAKKHPGYRARPFRGYIAHESLRKHPMSDTVIELWNKAD